MPKANNYLLENGKWPSVKNIVEQSDKLSGALKKYYLSTTEADNLLKLLFDRGITLQYLMPTLSNAIQSFKYASHLFKT